MRKLFLGGAVIALGLSLSGCAAFGQGASNSDALATKFLERCGGTVDIDVGGDTGQLGGTAHGSFKAHGECPTPPAVGTVIASDVK